MKTFMAFPICSLIFILLVAFVYFFKPRIKSIENGIYKWLLITNIIGLILEILCYVAVDIVNQNWLLAIGILKLYVVYLFVWSMIFNGYVFMVSYKNYTKDKENTNIYYKKLKKLLITITTLISVFMLFLPIKIYNNGNVAYTYGPITNFLIVLCFLLTSIWVVKCIMNYKSLKHKRYIPIIACILELILVLIIQSHDRSMLIATTGHSFLVLLMYFTIENPDTKIIDELNKNRTIVGQIMEDKSNFLFLASNQLKRPIEDIKEIADKSINLNNVERLRENIKEISNQSHNLSMFVNNVMDISTLSNANIKVVNEKYNLKNLLTKINILESKKVSEGVEFRFNVSDSIPEYLIGDSKLLEQILISSIENAIKYTKNGFIELRLNTIVKYDMARLIFTIEDSGLGMTTSKVNELLMVDSDLTSEELKRLETNNVNMNTIKKLVAKLGGYFTIKSEVNKGTEIKFVVDQKIITDKSLNLNNVTGKERILVATRNQELRHQLTYLLDKRGYAIETSIYSNDILDRIRLKEEFSYIFIDDDMDKRAIEVLNELKKNPKFKINVIVMINKDLEMIKDNLIKDGFTNYLIKEAVEKELERVLD